MLFKNAVKNISQTVAGDDLPRKDREVYYPQCVRHVVNIGKNGRDNQRVCQHGKKCRQKKMLFAQFASQHRRNKGCKRTEDNIPYNGVCQQV